MTDKLNSLSKAELEELRGKLEAKKKKELRECEYCGKPQHMRPDQKYCTSTCRTKAHNERGALMFEKLLAEKSEWEQERGELVAEINRLKTALAVAGVKDV